MLWRLGKENKRVTHEDAALAVKTSPSEWTCSITAPKIVAVDVTYKCASLNVVVTGEGNKRVTREEAALAVKASPSEWTCNITAPKIATVDVTYKCASLNVQCCTGEEK
jgi:hypothetical protein